MINTSRTRRWSIAGVVGVAGAVVVLLLIITLTDLDTGDAVASVVAAICGVLSGLAILLALRPSLPHDLIDVLRAYAGELGQSVNSELHARGLERRALLPLTLEPYGGARTTPPRSQRRPVQHNGATTWPRRALQHRMTKALLDRPGSRSIVFGEPGSGKTTAALMVAAELLERRQPDEAILLLQLDTWDDVESIDDWLERCLTQSYRSLRVLAGTPRSIARQLVYGASLTLLLDNLDSVPAQRRAQLVARLDEFIPESKHRVIFFSRFTDDRPYLAMRPVPAELHLVDCQAEAVAALFTSRARQAGSGATWEPVIDRLRRQPNGELARALGTPWHATLAWEVHSGPDHTPDGLLSLADLPARDIVATLHERFLSEKLKEMPRFSGALRYLGYMAHQMQGLGVRNVAWWHLYEALPTWVLMAFVGLSVAPAYQLALHLPQGLTRGFAIGSTAGICLGMLRGVRTTLVSGGIAAACTTLAVGLLGLISIGPRQTVADVAQISLAVGLTVVWRDRLVTGRAATLARILAIGALSAIAVRLTVVAGIGDGRSLASIFLSTALGLGVAVLACRLLSDPSMPQQPSRVAFGERRRWRRLPAELVTGIVASVPVGVAGGVAGAIQQHSVSYGIALALVFGVVAGIPIGLVGGAIRWVRTATTEFPAISPLSSLRSDRFVALTCIAAVGLVSTFSIAVFGDVLRNSNQVIGSGLTVEWYHGLMFGLSLGLVIACAYTAWPAFFAYHLYLYFGRRLPWRFGGFFEILHRESVLRRDGALYQFHQESLQDFLDESWHRAEGGAPCEPADSRPHSPAYYR